MITENCWNCLYIIFLGGAPAKGFQFMTPWPMHHAHWVLKVIYSVNVWRSQFKVTSKEKKGLRGRPSSPSVFTSKHGWQFLLRFLPRTTICSSWIPCCVRRCKSRYFEGSNHKIAWHLCYLSEDLIGLAFVLQECACSCETTCGPSLTATRRPSLEKPEWPACTNLVSRLHFHDNNHQCNTRVDNTGSVDKEFMYVPRVLWTRSPVCRKLSKKSRIVQLTPLRTRLCNLQFPFFLYCKLPNRFKNLLLLLQVESNCCKWQNM